MYNQKHRKQKQREASARWKKRHPDRAARAYAQHRLKKLYGLTIVERDTLVLAQNGCAACGSPTPNHKFGWAVDHDHNTGARRGILCYRCNATLGFVKDNPAHLKCLMDYLNKWLALRIT